MLSRATRSGRLALAGCRQQLAAVQQTQAQRRLLSGSKSEDEGPKLWGGRFTGAVDPLMEKFNASIGFDKRMWKEDLHGSMCYTRALVRAGLLTEEEGSKMQEGLELVHKEWAAGDFKIKSSDEDIHSANERRLTELIGSDVAGKLHTGRSRNDQVATDVRLWLKAQVKDLQQELVQLMRTATNRAEAEVDIIFPGYTHLQPAQPIRWGHYLMAYCNMWKRDAERLQDLLKRVDVMPLGSGALAGHAFLGPDDRTALAEDIGFSQGPSWNSLDATSDRDFVVEFLFWASLTGVHISKFAEDCIIYSSNEFKYMAMSDAYSTGSSLMPQKKNPDACELLRGKSGRNIGNLTTMLVALKGLPSTYNKDLQEDKEPLFDSVDTMKGCLPIATGVLATLKLNTDRMQKGLSADMLATDLADYLVRKGVPFRETHHISGQAVQIAENQNKPLSSVTLEELKTLHSAFEEDVEKVWSFESSVESRDAQGSTSRRSVLQQTAAMKEWLDNYEKSA
ncbi:Argininosuccinate lyase [Hondaea fermentalgiana]|uniref:Argininosuccinate lyase n=1 Tax=Hondaea fermentalgiana TaxID=2315210 RepID=A0A2R5GHT3_9STRA|nr:Argininosuccinate lyase [Hondaea fermentalgiana]|eukprot:GBG28213.1 Argininosuccinate lyase [Hondaea fermentalgiana]